MKGQFSVKPCNHGRANFVVSGRIQGKRINNFFRTKAEAQTHCERRNIELFNYGLEMAGMPNQLRAEALACSQRLAAIGAPLTTAHD